MKNIFKIILAIAVLAQAFIFPYKAAAISANVDYSIIERVYFTDKTYWATEFGLQVFDEDGNSLFSSPAYCLNIYSTTYEGPYKINTYSLNEYYNLIVANDPILGSTVTLTDLKQSAYVMEHYSPTFNDGLDYHWATAAQATIWGLLFDLELKNYGNNPAMKSAYDLIEAGFLPHDDICQYQVAVLWREDAYGNIIAHGQDLLIKSPLIHAPEPASIVLAALGFIGLIYVSLKKKRRSVA